MIGQIAIAIVLLGFTAIKCSMTPTFLFRNPFYLQLSPDCSKMNKNSMWEIKKKLRFLSTGHGITPSCVCKSHETMVANLFFKEPQQLPKLIGLLKQSLVGNISLQRSNCNISGPTDTVTSFAKEAQFFSDLGCSSGLDLFKTKSVTPISFSFLAKVDYYLFVWQVLKKSKILNIFQGISL